MENKYTFATILRHGESEWNRSGKHQGQLDSPLSERGIVQARTTAGWLARCSRKYDVLYSSDLGRSVQTAFVIARELRLDIRFDARLRERKLGILEGLTLEEFRKRHREEYRKYVSGDPDYIIPEGESIRQRYERAVSFLTEVAVLHEYQRILVVTHGGILDSIFRKVCSIDLNLERSFSLMNSSINTFVVCNGRWELMSWGNISHLDGIGTCDDE